MLKIADKARVKFSIGNYVDRVDYAVAPLSSSFVVRKTMTVGS
jgi:hypothetical protein